MKAGIITFQDANNYGAVLQAYALNKTINEYADCEIINYYNSYFHRNDSNKNIKDMIFRFLYKKSINNKKKEFETFRKKYLNLSDNYIKDDELKKLNSVYDCFISGSDQVWSLNCSGGNDAYFLDFVTDDKRKNSFSASFGSSQPSLDQKHIDFIKEFNNISVREKSGHDYLNKNRIKSVKTSDPVFLLKQNEWKKLTNKIDEDYILVYEVVNGVNMITFAKSMSEKTGYKVKVITSSNKPLFGVDVYRNAGPLTWLSLFNNAKYVVTNSFHGLAFSLIFNKQFYLELLQNSSSNNRMLELLDDYNLRSRILNKSFDVVDDGIDYRKINEKMKKNRGESLEYIEKMIGGYKNDK